MKDIKDIDKCNLTHKGSSGNRGMGDEIKIKITQDAHF